MSTEATAAAAKKPGPAKKLKQYGYITVDKNNYTKNVSELANQPGVTILNVTTNPNVLNSFDVHYFKLV
jgi:hypothetical protein